MEESILCSKCSTPLGAEDVFCPNCGYPEKADQSKRDKYKYRIKIKQDVVDDAKKKLKSVKVVLYIIIASNVLFGLSYLSEEATFVDGISSLVAALIFVGCLVWVNKKPLVGILAAFALWILLQLSVVLVDPALLFQGLFVKIIFIVIFIKGISSAKDYQEYSTQLKEMNANWGF